MNQIFQSIPSLEQFQKTCQQWLDRVPLGNKTLGRRASPGLILDWQKDSLLLARALGSGTDAKLTAASVQPFGKLSDNRSVSAAEAVRSAVQHSGQKGDVTVLVARELVELRTLQLPFIDQDDLPDVIRFQAQRQFANLSDACAVDYVLLPPVPGQELQTALVAAMPPGLVNEIETACSAAGLNVAQIAFRPLEIVRLATQSQLVPAGGRSMIVCVADNEADLLLVRDGQVVMVRSTNLPHEDNPRKAALQAEVRRSLLAAASELGNQPIDQLLLVVAQEQEQDLVATLQQATRAAVVTFHPDILLPTSDRNLVHQAATRLTGMAGALSIPFVDAQAVIDFKNPKRRPPAQSHRRTWILSGAAAASIFLMGYFWYSSTLSGLKQEADGYRSEINSKKEIGQSAQNSLMELKEIEAFLGGAPNWLDELVYVADRMPGAEKIKLDYPSFAIVEGAGVLKFGVKADTSDSLADFEESVRDEQHIVSGAGGGELASGDQLYRWAADTTIRLTGRGWPLASATSSTPVSNDQSKATTEPSSETPASVVNPTSESNQAQPAGEGVTDASEADADDSEREPN